MLELRPKSPSIGADPNDSEAWMETEQHGARTVTQRPGDPGDTGDYHPSADLLRRFVNGLLEESECLQVVRHLLRDCPACRAVANEIWHSSEDARLGRLGKVLRLKALSPSVVDSER